MSYAFKKITTINGFDVTNHDNARQNNYAWAMTEMDDYLYVGTGRNIFYNVMQFASKQYGFPIELPDSLTPKNYDNRGEIWRYNKKHPKAGWKKVFKAPAGISGFRFMIVYTSPGGERALYAGTFNSNPQMVIYKTIDGQDWKELRYENIPGNSTRAMIIHNNKLYMAVQGDLTQEVSSKIYVSSDPESDGWSLVTGSGDPNKNPRGEINTIRSFNGYIYAGTNKTGGFEVWRTESSEPAQDNWKLVIDKGAGDGANWSAATLKEFKGELYVGTAAFPFIGELSITGFKPFDLIRIDKNDRWVLVIGGKPLQPTEPTTGIRQDALSGRSSGLGNKFNLYCWQLQEYRGEFYLGTFDWSVLIAPTIVGIIKGLLKNFKSMQTSIIPLILKLLGMLVEGIRAGYFVPVNGFDIFKSSDGLRWEVVTLNGLRNSHNYGARNLFASSDGHMYVGTANPFDGCEVWKNNLTF